MHQYTSKLLRASFCCASALALAACFAVPPSIMDSRSGVSLSAGESSHLHFFTHEADFDTGVELIAGGQYALTVVLLNHWTDSAIAVNESGERLNEKGFANSVMPYSWLGNFRRSNSHQWFELMLYQPRCAADSLRGVSDLQYYESSGSYQFVATCDGKLALFVNDNYLTYANNRGYAGITINRVN